MSPLKEDVEIRDGKVRESPYDLEEESYHEFCSMDSVNNHLSPGEDPGTRDETPAQQTP